MITTEFSDLIAERMAAEHQALAARWFERLLDLLPVEAREVFPTESLLDHIPSLIREISTCLRQPEEAIAANSAILEKARELGALRHAQRASLHQVLREYQLLGGILVTFVLEEIERGGQAPSPTQSVAAAARLHQAVNILSQYTVEAFVGLYTQTIAAQNERLEEFTRMASHELRQPLGVVQFGVGLLRQNHQDPARAQKTLEAVERNVQQLVDLTHKLESIARMQSSGDDAVVQEVSLGSVAQEAARQLREMADARGVEIRIADSLPTVTVDVGRLELILLNLLSNAVKYSDPAKPIRTVDVTATAEDDGCRIEVRDNGLGIPAEALATIFKRFTRAHADRHDLPRVTGIGLGLSIVEDSVRVLGGRIEVESVEAQGTTFLIQLPSSPSS